MRKYVIYLWSGCGYVLTPFEVEGFNEEDALENLVSELIKTEQTAFYEECETIEEMAAEDGRDAMELEGWLYVDATMNGAPRPVFIRTENMKITEVK